MKYLIIQPSCGEVMRYCSHLVLGHYDISEVLTIENNNANLDTESELFKFIGVPFHCLDITFDKKLDIQTQMDIECQIQEFLIRFFKENRREEKIVVIPLGNKNSFNLFIRKCIERLLSVVWYYKDSPIKGDLRYKELYVENISKIFDIKLGLMRKFYKKEIKGDKEIIYINKEQELPF